MGRNVYQFFLKDISENYSQVCESFITQGYSVVKQTDTMGIFLEKVLSYGIIEINLNDYESNYRYSIRIAKPNSEETVAILLKDIIEIKKQFPELTLYDIEVKKSIDLNDEKFLKKNFLKAKEEFLVYFSETSNKAPVRGDEVFKKQN